MAQLEQLELDAHRDRLAADVKGLVEKYRTIFAWDVPEVDLALTDRLILDAIRQALDGIERASSDRTLR